MCVATSSNKYPFEVQYLTRAKDKKTKKKEKITRMTNRSARIDAENQVYRSSDGLKPGDHHDEVEAPISERVPAVHYLLDKARGIRMTLIRV